MADITIGGRGIEIDTSVATVGEWRRFWGGKLTDAQEDELITRMTGLTAEDIDGMTRGEYVLLMRAVVQAPVKVPKDTPDNPS